MERSEAIRALVRYALDRGLIQPSEEMWAVNALLEALSLDSYTPPEGEPAAEAELGALATLATRQVVSSGMAGLVAQLAVFGAGAGVPAVFLFVKNRDLVRQVRRRHTGTGPVRTP